MFNPSDQRLSNPPDERTVMHAWDNFLSGQAAAPNALRRLIDDSWHRCLAEQVDPARRAAAPPIGYERLAAMRHQHRELLTAGKQVMAMAKDLLAQTDTIMILADPNGMILSVEGDPRALEAAGEIHLAPGSCWSELLCGTNAIGTALSIGQPVQIHAAEHFCSGIKQWTCAAAVIRDPYDGKVVGVIDVSGLGRTFSRHSLALAASTASRIESQLIRLELDFRYQLLECGMSRLSGSVDGIIICDRRGYPIKANEQATAALLARGIDYDLKNKVRIPTLGSGVFADGGRATAPAWLRGDWIENIVDAGEHIGTLLTIPGPPAVRASQASASASAGDAGRGFAGIVGGSVQLAQAMQKARLLARGNAAVLLLGETGVGKERFAQGIHLAGPAGARPFVALNCGGLSADLLASELFGHAEGAFTGSRRGGMKGKVEAADGGTLFLDELGEMPLELQPHFLRVLEEGEIYRIGETKPRKISFKLIAATNRDLRHEVAEGRFRMDLFYRVSVTSVHIPPLRERDGDIALLAGHYLDALARQHGDAPKSMSAEVLAALEAHDWPGNVRELRNVVESMFLMSESATLRLADLPPELAPALEQGNAAAGEAYATGKLEHVEALLIRDTIVADHGNLTLVAKHLGIAKSTLYVKLKKYGLERRVHAIRDGLM